MVINWKCDPCRDAVLVAHIEANAEKHILYHNIWSVRKLRTRHTGRSRRTCPEYVILYGPQCTNYGEGQLDQMLCLGAWCRWLSSELIVSKLSAQG